MNPEDQNPNSPTVTPSVTPNATPGSNTDSFDVPVKRSPLFLFALLQIPIVILMVLMIWFMYQTQSS